VLNVILISFFNNPIEIIAVSNIGYVFATCAALAGFLLLRKDRPAWPRPVHLPSLWVPLGAVLLTANVVFLVTGGFIYSGGFLGIDGYGYGWDKTRWGLLVLLVAILLYVFRHVVQDKQPIKWREEVPATPEEQMAHPELAPAPTAAPAV
jgi:amino acid transporter